MCLQDENILVVQEEWLCLAQSHRRCFSWALLKGTLWCSGQCPQRFAYREGQWWVLCSCFLYQPVMKTCSQVRTSGPHPSRGCWLRRPCDGVLLRFPASVSITDSLPQLLHSEFNIAEVTPPASCSWWRNKDPNAGRFLRDVGLLI